MGYLAKTLFPFRVFSFIAIYVTCNIVLYTLDSSYTGPANPILNYYQNKIDSAIISPNMAPSMREAVRANFRNSQIVQDKTDSIRIMLIFADIFLVLLFISLIVGIITTSAQLSFIQGFLHFVGAILVTHCILSGAHINFVICGTVFGVFLPTVIEIWVAFAIFVLKTDFY